jgi:hypothetical protein
MYNKTSKLNRGVMLGVGTSIRLFIGDKKLLPDILKNWLTMALQAGREICLKLISWRVLRRFPMFFVHFPFLVAVERKKTRNQCRENAKVSVWGSIPAC